MKRGDVVRVDWPFSDRTGSKIRPAVVIQADRLNARIDDTMLALVTRTARAPGITEVPINPAIETQCGLRFVSIVSCNNILTVDRRLIIQSIGELSPTAMAAINKSLQVALELP